MINKNGLLRFIFILTWLWLNSWLRSCRSNFRSLHRYTFRFFRSHYSVTFNSFSSWLLLSLTFFLLLLYYSRWTYILLQMLLIFFILINAWSEIWFSMSWWNNLLALHFDVRTSSSTFSLVHWATWFFALGNSRLVINHMCFHWNSTFSFLEFNSFSFRIISIPLGSAACVVELRRKLINSELIITDFTGRCRRSLSCSCFYNVSIIIV